ncbi:MAG: DUF1684 domain-containing protein [Caldilineaceae bacterium]
MRQSTLPLAERWAVWRQTRDQIFAHHPQSSLTAAQKETFTGLAYHPYDPAWRFEAVVDTAVEPTIFPIETAHDGVVRAQRFGKVHLMMGGEQLVLSLFWLLGYGGGLFLPFRDATNGHATYGGGRYLLDTIKHADLGQTADGKLILDFNYAYNPSCAYNDQWSCPLAPPENWLIIPVPVGEKAFLNPTGGITP